MTHPASRSHRNPEPSASASACGQSTHPESRGERRLVSPFRCRVWTQHSRPEEQLTEAACKSLRDSIAKSGQHQPVLARPVTDDPDYDVEIICGARRHAAALALGRNLLIEVRPLTDAEAYVAMYEENAERKDDCPYVQGQILRRALNHGACSTQEDLARAFNLSQSRVSRLLTIAQLPSIVVAAFRSPRDIRESWGVTLYQLWRDKDPGHTITDRARSLARQQPRPAAHHVYDALITAPGDLREIHRVNRIVPVRGADGVILFHEEERGGNVTFIVSKTLLSAIRREALRQVMVKVLDRTSTGVASDRSAPNAPASAPRRPLSI